MLQRFLRGFSVLRVLKGFLGFLGAFLRARRPASRLRGLLGFLGLWVLGSGSFFVLFGLGAFGAKGIINPVSTGSLTQV